jgi:hypothetical protein
MDEPLNNLEAGILLVLEQHQGEAEAIKRKPLVQEVCDIEGLEICDRTIRATIKHLITQHGFAIGSKGGKKGGYYMCETPDEIDRVAKYFDGIGLCSFFTASKLRKIEMRDYLGQLSMRFGS